MSTESLTELAELILKKINYFQFNDRFRKQKEGTAIGTKFASPCAIIFMATLKEEILSLIKKPWLWWRYLWFLITEKMNLNNLLISSRNFMPPQSLLVIFLRKSSLSRCTRYFRKQRNINWFEYLHPSSCHPYYCVKSIPYS